MEAPTDKFNLLLESFLTLFPGFMNFWKNSQGIFNDLDCCMVKRSVISSVHPVSLESSALPRDFVCTRTHENRVWGLCGADSTRNNRATDKTFVLLNQVEKKKEKHYVAVAIVTFHPNPHSVTGYELAELDTSSIRVNGVLEEMKKEKEEYSKAKLERKMAGSKKRGRGRSSVSEQPDTKRVRFSDTNDEVAEYNEPPQPQPQLETQENGSFCQCQAETLHRTCSAPPSVSGDTESVVAETAIDSDIDNCRDCRDEGAGNADPLVFEEKNDFSGSDNFLDSNLLELFDNYGYSDPPFASDALNGEIQNQQLPALSGDNVESDLLDSGSPFIWGSLF